MWSPDPASQPCAGGVAIDAHAAGNSAAHKQVGAPGKERGSLRSLCAYDAYSADRLAAFFGRTAPPSDYARRLDSSTLPPRLTVDGARGKTTRHARVPGNLYGCSTGHPPRCSGQTPPDIPRSATSSHELLKRLARLGTPSPSVLQLARFGLHYE